MFQFWWLVPLGFIVGAYGTLIGAGGGFVLMPILLLVYPKESPVVLTSISLAVVFFNAASGTLAYSKMKRVDYKSGGLFMAATIPGAVFGALATAWIPRHAFDMVLGGLLVCGSAFLIWHPVETHGREHHPKHFIKRRLVDTDGNVHEFAYNPYLGVALSFVVGFISSLLGIGGGIVHVPALVHLMDFPVHFATATSHFVLAGMSLAGTVTHLVNGVFADAGSRRTLFLAVGVLAGAQVGARLSARIHGVWIIRGLAIALGLVGVRVLMAA